MSGSTKLSRSTRGVTATANEANATLASNSLSAAEIAVLDGVTAGTATASKAVVLDGSKGIATITSATITTATIPNFAGAETHAGAITAQSTLDVTGAVTASSTLAVTGAITPTGGVAAAAGGSVSPRLIYTGGKPPLDSSDGVNATPVSTETYIAELFIPCNMTITGVAVFNGSVASGNMKACLATAAGVPISAATTASTAMVGTDVMQLIPFAVAYAAKGPQTLYLLLQVDNGTARINCHGFGTFGAGKKTGEVYGTFTTVTPPTTFTANLAPMAGLY